MQLYYVSPLLWSTLRQGWDAAMLLPLAFNVLSLALIAERRSRHLAKLLVVAVVLRTIGPELNPALVILTAYLARWRPLSQALLSGTAALLACAGEGFRGNWNPGAGHRHRNRRRPWNPAAGEDPGRGGGTGGGRPAG